MAEATEIGPCRVSVEPGRGQRSGRVILRITNDAGEGVEATLSIEQWSRAVGKPGTAVAGRWSEVGGRRPPKEASET